MWYYNQMKKKSTLLKALLLTPVILILAFIVAHGFFGNLSEKSRLSHVDGEIQSIYSILVEYEDTNSTLSDRGLIDRGSCWYIAEQDETYCTSSSNRFLLEIDTEELDTTISGLDQYMKSSGFEVYTPGNGELLVEALNRNAVELNQFEADMEYRKVLHDDGTATRYSLKMSLAYTGDCLNSASQSSGDKISSSDLVKNGQLSACTSISAIELHPGRLDWNTPNTSESDGPVRIDPIE